jgi:sugar phosphate isomerase/epimerase
MNKPKIGIKTWDLSYKGPGKIVSSVLEIASKDYLFGFRRKDLDKIKKLTKGKDLSLHTQTKRVFSDKNKTLRELEIETLRAEILACSYLKARELIVHLKQEKLTKKEIQAFKEILSFAKKNEVEVLYEPNGNFIAKNFLYNLNQFPGLKINLDICHLGMAVKNKTLKMDLVDFLETIRARVVYIHASGYNGREEHWGLDKSVVDWKVVLDNLDLRKIRKIIIELHHFEEFKKTKEDLESYLDGRLK